MKILILDTAVNSGIVALALNNEVKHYVKWDGVPKHAEVLADNIQTALSEINWKPDDINGVGVALGPGSFTGLRIGLATAKGFCAGLNIPIAGFSSLDALAFSEKNFEGTVVATVDARRKEIYAKAYNFKKHETVFDVKTITPIDFRAWLSNSPKPVLLTGSGAVLYPRDFEMDGVEIRNSELPNVNVLPEMVLEKLKKGGDDVDSLIPSYIRVSDAEIGFLGRVGK